MTVHGFHLYPGGRALAGATEPELAGRLHTRKGSGCACRGGPLTRSYRCSARGNSAAIGAAVNRRKV